MSEEKPKPPKVFSLRPLTAAELEDLRREKKERQQREENAKKPFPTRIILHGDHPKTSGSIDTEGWVVHHPAGRSPPDGVILKKVLGPEILSEQKVLTSGVDASRLADLEAFLQKALNDGDEEVFLRFRDEFTE